MSFAKDDELKVVIKTNKGTIEAKLFPKEAPMTVSNFVTLARSGFYNGIIFHRVIPKFMIQTGDPKGNGSGGPGYSFKDEFSPNLKHNKAGILSMANAGPATNGSQFFVTVAPTQHLDNRHTIFGEVTKGLDVAIKISEAPTNGSTPTEKILMESVSIVGDWYKPGPIDKVLEISDDEIRKLTTDIAKNLLSKTSESLDLGKLESFSMKQAKANGMTAQVAYEASFAKAKTSQLILLGKKEGKSFQVQQFQFGLGNP
jgi:cyclophilin family peptidyl-prolyl cis-trans isomerase